MNQARFILKKVSLVLPALLLGGALSANAAAPLTSDFQPTAYVYAGKGVCAEGCVEAVTRLTRRNGIVSVLVRESDLLSDRIRPRVGDIWIQPGGDAIVASEAMTAIGLARVRNWISKGMNYLGFCAGAFLADRTVDDSETIGGLGLIPFPTADFLPGQTKAMVLEQNWRGASRWLYFQEGATFEMNTIDAAAVKVIATYTDGRASVIDTRFGSGRVVLSGVHPEALPIWLTDDRLTDPDGSDDDLADELLGRVSR